MSFAGLLRRDDDGGPHLVLLEERAADVAVEGVGEVVPERREARLQHVRLVGVVDRHREEVHEPAERVLVHRVDVGEVGDREEEDGRVDRDRSVPHSRRVNLLLRLLGNRLPTGRDTTTRFGSMYVEEQADKPKKQSENKKRTAIATLARADGMICNFGRQTHYN